MSLLLDTKVLCELRKGVRAHPQVRRWSQINLDRPQSISVLSIGEICDGIVRVRIRDLAQGDALERWLVRVRREFDGAILPVTEEIAERWGRVCRGQTLPPVDALIAATALVHDLTVATRNVRDFKRCGVPVVNPFEENAAHG